MGLLFINFFETLKTESKSVAEIAETVDIDRVQTHSMRHSFEFKTFGSGNTYFQDCLYYFVTEYDHCPLRF